MLFQTPLLALAQLVMLLPISAVLGIGAHAAFDHGMRTQKEIADRHACEVSALAAHANLPIMTAAARVRSLCASVDGTPGGSVEIVRLAPRPPSRISM